MRRLLTIIGVLLAGITMAQVSVQIRSENDSIRVGDPIELEVNIKTTPSNILSIDFSDWKTIDNQFYAIDSTRADQYFDLSILDGTAFDITNEKWTTESTAITGKIIVTSYTMGIGALLAPKVILKDSTVMQRGESLLMVYPPKGMEMGLDTIPIGDIKPILVEEKNWQDYLPILYTILGLLIVGLLGWYLFSRKKSNVEEEVEEIVEVIPAHTTALQALTALDQRQLWQKGEIKAYQSELTHIMRQYIEERYDVPALEMTSSEIKRSLMKLKLDDQLVAKMNDILQIADVVKFAKGKVGPEINQQFMSDSIDWVQRTKKREAIRD